ATVKIYTRTGDDGSTGLLGPGRVSKASARVEAYGAVDELNAALGLVRALDREGWLAGPLERIQGQLFTVGAELAATAPAALRSPARIADPDVTLLEGEIDRLEADLPPLTHFLLPAGTPLAAQLHLARAIGRRAERRVVALATSEDVAPVLLRYLNRLADLLFVMARWSNHRAGQRETEWHGAREKD